MADTWAPKSFTPTWQPKSFESSSVSKKTNVSQAEPSIWDKTKQKLGEISEPLIGDVNSIRNNPSRIDQTEADKRNVRTHYGEDWPVVGKGIKYLNDKIPTAKAGDPQYKIIGEPSSTSILPANITGKHEPEDFWSGAANSLYKDFVRPLASPQGFMSSMSPGKISPTASHAANARPGLPPAPPDITNPAPKTRFYSGDKGVADITQKYQMDTAPINPRLGQTDAGTILPREVEGVSDIGALNAPRLGTTMGDISKIETSSPKANIVGLSKVRDGAPVQLPKINKPDITVPNERSLADSFAPTELPEPNARPYGSTNKGTKTNPVWDTAGESKFKPQTFVPASEEMGVGKTAGEPKSFEVVKNRSNAKPSEGVPAPGSAVSVAPEKGSIKNTGSKDINSFRAEFGSVDKTLNSRPETAPIAAAITGAQDTKTAWIATTERDLAQYTAGLKKSDRTELWSILNRGVQSIDHPDLAQRATKIKEALDDIWSQIPGAKTDSNVGFIDNYISHIKNLGDDDIKSGIQQIWDYHIGDPAKKLFSSEQLAGKGSGLGDMYDKGIGNPNSPFVQTRKGGLTDLEMDVNKVLPAYIESIARVIHDQPAVDAAKQVLKTLPDTDIYGAPSKIKELSKWYIKNYSRYDSMPGLSEAWNDVTNKMMRTTARSMLGFSTGLQTLHLARIPANLYPELGGKYLATGAKQLIKNPKAAYMEAASLGLLQNEVRPMAFKTLAEKGDSLLSFWSAADFLDKTIGYYGFKQKFLDAGMGEAEASSKAIAASKKASLTVDPARVIKGFNPSSGPAGTFWKLTTQFKQVPVKIIEQVAGIAAQAKTDPAQAARMIAGIGTAYGLMEAGLHTFHISPGQFALDSGGASGRVMVNVYRKAVKGDVMGALTDVALWLTPSGKSIQSQLKRGFSAFEHENSSLRQPK